MAKDVIIDRLKEEFEGKEIISREELLAFYRQLEPDLKESTFRWRIYYLKSKQIITTISRGLFTLSYKPAYKPDISDAERKLFSKIEKQFPSLKVCLWSTDIAHEFMLHIPGRFITVLQVEKEALEPVFSYLKDQNFRSVFIEPGEKELERYIYENETAIVLQSLISKSPTQRVKNVTTTTLEKLIVDLFCDKKLFAAFQGNELAHIINKAYKRYSIDFTRLFHYAKRRRKDSELAGFFSDKTEIPKNILND